MTETRVMATVTAMMWVMATVTRLAGDKEGKGGSGKGDGDGDEGGRQRRGNGDGGKSGVTAAMKRVMVTVTRVVEVGRQQNGQWQWRQERW